MVGVSVVNWKLLRTLVKFEETDSSKLVSLYNFVSAKRLPLPAGGLSPNQGDETELPKTELSQAVRGRVSRFLDVAQ